MIGEPPLSRERAKIAAGRSAWPAMPRHGTDEACGTTRSEENAPRTPVNADRSSNVRPERPKKEAEVLSESAICAARTVTDRHRRCAQE